MSGLLLPSTPLDGIDPNNCYFNPGCALAMTQPAAAGGLLALLRRWYGPVRPHDVCCHHDPLLPAGSVLLNNCAGCDRRFRSLYPGITTITLWEVLDSIAHLPLPNHAGLTVSVQDPCSFRPKPQVHAAVRSLLRKMNVEIVEAPASGIHSICCGDNFYPTLAAERVMDLQRKRAAQMPCQDVVVYCVSCTQSMAIGGKTPHHLADLVLGSATTPLAQGLEEYHAALGRYIEEH